MKLEVRKTRMRIINAVFFLLFIWCPVVAQEADSTSSSVEIRQFDGQKLDSYRSDSDFQYELAKPEEESALARLWQRIQNWFLRILGSGTASTIWSIAWRVGVVIAFVYFIIKLFGVEVTTLFKPNKVNKLDYEVNEEELHNINFEEEIAKALGEKQWRFAIRLIYLNALKLMGDSGLLRVKKGKTNRDYLYEISGKDVEKDFERLSFIFDYTWYGHFEANDAIVAEAQDHFSKIEGVKEGGR